MRQLPRLPIQSEFAEHAGYGYCPSKSLFVWGMRPVLTADPKGVPARYHLVGPKTGQEPRPDARPAAAAAGER